MSGGFTTERRQSARESRSTTASSAGSIFGPGSGCWTSASAARCSGAEVPAARRDARAVAVGHQRCGVSPDVQVQRHVDGQSRNDGQRPRRDVHGHG